MLPNVFMCFLYLYIFVDLLEDCSLADMRIHWSLHGACLHHLSVAMCIAPLLNTNLTLSQRCETALTGFVVLDLFAMVSREKEVKYRMPSGSASMAKQTQGNLQSCALAAAVVCITMEDDFDGFKRWGRLSELAIEHWFGHIRLQSANAQHSARSFFRAEARQMLKLTRQLNEQKAPKRQNEGGKLRIDKCPGMVTVDVFHCFSFLLFCFGFVWQQLVAMTYYKNLQNDRVQKFSCDLLCIY